jgi:hypothetical protein
MMDAAGLPKNLWAEAVRHHVWIHNRVPTRALPDMKMPHEMGTGKKPDLSGIRAWGCKVWVKKLNIGKLDMRAEEVEGCRVKQPTLKVDSDDRIKLSSLHRSENRKLLQVKSRIDNYTFVAQK